VLCSGADELGGMARGGGSGWGGPGGRSSGSGIALRKFAVDDSAPGITALLPPRGSSAPLRRGGAPSGGGAGGGVGRGGGRGGASASSGIAGSAVGGGRGVGGGSGSGSGSGAAPAVGARRVAGAVGGGSGGGPTAAPSGSASARQLGAVPRDASGRGLPLSRVRGALVDPTEVAPLAGGGGAGAGGAGKPSPFTPPPPTHARLIPLAPTPPPALRHTSRHGACGAVLKWQGVAPSCPLSVSVRARVCLLSLLRPLGSGTACGERGQCVRAVRCQGRCCRRCTSTSHSSGSWRGCRQGRASSWHPGWLCPCPRARQGGGLLPPPPPHTPQRLAHLAPLSLARAHCINTSNVDLRVCCLTLNTPLFALA
jgi:hypothetical protein